MSNITAGTLLTTLDMTTLITPSTAGSCSEPPPAVSADSSPVMPPDKRNPSSSTKSAMNSTNSDQSTKPRNCLVLQCRLTRITAAAPSTDNSRGTGVKNKTTSAPATSSPLAD